MSGEYAVHVVANIATLLKQVHAINQMLCSTLNRPVVLVFFSEQSIKMNTTSYLQRSPHLFRNRLLISGTE